MRWKALRVRRRRTRGERGKENRGVEDRAGTRTADKGRIKAGIYILNKRGSRGDKNQGRRKAVTAVRGGKDKPQERPTDTNGRTGSETD